MQGNRWAVSTENSWTKSVAYFHNCSSGVDYCEDCFHIRVFIRSSNICLSYIHSSITTYAQLPNQPIDVLKKQYLPPLALVSLCFSFRMTQPNFFFSHFEVNVSFPSAHKKAWLDCYWERVLFFQKPVKPTCEARRERRVNSSRCRTSFASLSPVLLSFSTVSKGAYADEPKTGSCKMAGIRQRTKVNRSRSPDNHDGCLSFARFFTRNHWVGAWRGQRGLFLVRNEIGLSEDTSSDLILWTILTFSKVYPSFEKCTTEY